MATHCSILSWKIPWTEEPGRLRSVGSQRVRHDWATNAFSFIILINYVFICMLASLRHYFLSFTPKFCIIFLGGHAVLCVGS